MSAKYFFAIVVGAFAAAVSAKSATTDPHSYAEPDRVRISALRLDLEVDFSAQRLNGSAELVLDWKDPQARRLVLDTRDLDISGIESFDEAGHRVAAEFTLSSRDPIKGSALTITLEQPAPRIRIAYRTSPEATGLQWLTRAQTASGRQPFMFSQSQAIHARSWIPLQDTPAVRFTYTANIRVPKGLRAVMSADNDAAHALDGDFRFAMDKPIPSYLLALAVGDLAVRATGPRSAIYAEPATVAGAAKEFEDTEKMIATTESLYGPYRWGRYDILVLPPSFPFGGMENPRMTFATPTVIAGDKSLVSLVAHELAHSWSGNLVTNASWQHVWLNEGFTTYVENRIVEAVFGKDQAAEEFVVAARSLREDFKELPVGDQRLVPDLSGRDADDSLSDVPYTKGAWLLRTLETRFGRETFDKFLRGYFDHFAFRSITTENFVDYLKANLLAQNPGKFSEAELAAWLHEPGIPKHAMLPPVPRFIAIDAVRADWLAGKRDAISLRAQKWSTQEWMYFLDTLPDALGSEQMRSLDAAYKLTGTGNAEIARRWYLHAIASGYAPAADAMQAYMKRIGRRYLTLPLYQALAKTATGKERAKVIYAEAKAGYHPIMRASVEKALQ